MKTVNYKDTQIAYTEAGSVDDVTLFFVHGSFINKEYWSEQINFLRSDYHIIAIDLPGHGESPKGSRAMTIRNLGDAVTSVIKDLKLKNVILIGHSLGADVILEACINSPDKIIGFVVVDYFKNVGMPLPADVVNQVLTGLKSDFSKTMETYVRTGLVTKRTDSKLADRILTAYQNMDQAAAFESIDDMFKYTSREHALLEQLKMKVYLINVDYMPTNEDALKAVLKKGYELTTLKGTCHFPMIEDPDGLNHALQSVVEKIDQQSKLHEGVRSR